ncbi:DoxX family protein [Niabella soli]|uniref:DoxX family protein n=1 Tax=Niabella soli TaxID=446683 RepID=UPI00024997FE|nr:DoxX family protein [Niabella soli]
MKLLSSKYKEVNVSVALLLLRVTSGAAMVMNHGIKKLTGFNQIASKGFADPFHIGVKLSLGLTLFAELFCALLLIAGLLTRLAAIPLIIAMSVALFHAHGGDFFGQGELPGVYLAIFLTLLIIGPGKYSMDKAIGK